MILIKLDEKLGGKQVGVSWQLRGGDSGWLRFKYIVYTYMKFSNNK